MLSPILRGKFLVLFGLEIFLNINDHAPVLDYNVYWGRDI